MFDQSEIISRLKFIVIRLLFWGQITYCNANVSYSFARLEYLPPLLFPIEFYNICAAGA